MKCVIVCDLHAVISNMGAINFSILVLFYSFVLLKFLRPPPRRGPGAARLRRRRSASPARLGFAGAARLGAPAAAAAAKILRIWVVGNVRKRPKNVRKRPKTFENGRKRLKTSENFRKTSEEHPKTSENVRKRPKAVRVAKYLRSQLFGSATIQPQQNL